MQAEHQRRREMDRRRALGTIDTATPNVARMWDYQLGGKDNFAADAQAAEAVNRALQRAGVPSGREAAWENRSFIHRAVRFLAEEAGIRQFVDIGSGLPSMGNVHEIALHAAPDARVVYVDYDPVVLVHARALLGTDTPDVTVVQADLRHPEEVFADPDLLSLIDLDQPVAVLLIAVLHLVTPAENPGGIVRRILAALPPGSYLATTHATSEVHSEGAAVLAGEFERLRVTTPMIPRSRAEILSFFEGLELVDPGLTFPSQWRTDTSGSSSNPGAAWMLAGVGRKP
jgi:hypothetical protein